MMQYSSPQSSWESSISTGSISTVSGNTDGNLSDVSDEEPFHLWRKYAGLQPLPGFATNVVLCFREKFTSDAKKTARTERLKAAGLLTDVNESEETQLVKAVCTHLMYNEVQSVQLVSNCQEYVTAVTEEANQNFNDFENVQVEELGMSTKELVTNACYNYTDVTVALLLTCRGRFQQQKLWEIVSNAYKASRRGVVIIGNTSILTDIIFWQQWGDYVNYLRNEGGGWKDHLEIVCRKHHVVNRHIVTANDLVTNSPYGGCAAMCGEMKCGHYCAHVCHAIDPEHQFEEFKCRLPCQRKCDFGHKCNEICCQDCDLCYQVIPVQTSCVHAPGREKQVFCYQRSSVECKSKVTKKLNCGHPLVVECSTDVSKYKCSKMLGYQLECGHLLAFECWKNIQEVTCQVPILKKFPCGHEMILRCEENRMYGDTLQCNQFCNGTLPCTHRCPRKCHLFEDPNHEKFQCREPCQRSCPRGLHPCSGYGSHPCFEPCQPCTKFFEYPLICGHGITMQCNELEPDPDTYYCKERCMRKYPFCLHPCEKMCGEDCGRCVTLVCKANTGCPRDHFTMVPCQVARDPKCKVEVVPREIPDCGHLILVECHEADTITKSQLAELCRARCTARFDGENECGHKCRGRCSDCFQGRFHMRCLEVCGRTLICGHCCPNPCGMVCPPCRYICFNSCEHGECPYECGVPCVRDCEQPCPYECDHLKCTRKCHEVCDRKGCKMSCSKTLKCGHPCVGFCGEPCPPQCRVCNPEKLLDGSFSGAVELAPEDKFIYLPDCGHCVQSNDFEIWINIKSDEILPFRCPVCNARLKWIRRYSQLFSANHQLVQSVREKIFGDKKDIKKILKDVQRDIVVHLEETNRKPHFSEFVDLIMLEISRPIFAKPDLAAKMEFQSISLDIANFLKWATAEWINASKILSKYFMKLKPAHFRRFSLYWEEYLIDMLTWRVWPLHPNEFKAINVERVRLEDVVSLYARMDVTTHPRMIQLISSFDCMRLFRLAEQTVSQNKPYTQDIREAFQRQLRDLDAVLSCTIKISEPERLEIIAAFGQGSGRWFKCAKGHVYVVTECGGATEMGKCNVCGADIGGENHVLVQENYLATEMDGAETPLYPTALQRNDNP